MPTKGAVGHEGDSVAGAVVDDAVIEVELVENVVPVHDHADDAGRLRLLDLAHVDVRQADVLDLPLSLEIEQGSDAVDEGRVFSSTACSRYRKIEGHPERPEAPLAGELEPRRPDESTPHSPLGRMQPHLLTTMT